ncbi:hypothetical protein [Massilia violaceinigra]|uniref:hypothetical protein n=1 Tax=Massilia violaceinigra TaxID=2045208 RepID=UPI001ABF01E6|nr:hypothetical protein [Massilia violaceinigra]
MPGTTPIPLVEPAKPAAAAAPRAVIGPAEAIALTVGVVVGTGIFKAPALVAGMTGSAPWMFAAWARGGLMSLIGALWAWRAWAARKRSPPTCCMPPSAALAPR